MIKTSKIARINQVKDWAGEHGTILFHQLEMENGDKIEIGKKKAQLVGWEITYEITDTGQEYNKASARQPENASNSFKSKKGGGMSEKGLMARSALDKAVAFCSAQMQFDSTLIKDEAVCDTANVFLKWLNDNA